MKKVTLFVIFALIIMSCRDDDVNVFEKTADERVAEAVSSLKEKLVDPENGWLVRYSHYEVQRGQHSQYQKRPCR
jgi:hypothetical protein